jgi:hypothetical protein
MAKAANAAKGAKKGRRFNRPRPDKAKRLCAERKAARRATQQAAAKRNEELRAAGQMTPWELAKARRYEARHTAQV